MSDRLTVLIVGGYGTFGGRIVELLEHEPRLTLIVAGRSIEKAQRFCESRARAVAELTAAAFDRGGDLAAQLRWLGPNLVVDASGPFQSYGERPYRLVEACIGQGLDYLDLADGSDFVAGVAAFDEAARGAGRYALCGVSSFPVLTAAAVRRLAVEMARVDTITGGIAPSPFAGVGANVIRAIAGYAGRRVTLRRGGKSDIGRPFTEQRRYTIAPPGRLPLRSTMFSLVDVPDLRALPELWPDARNVWMGAGPVPEVLHRALIACAWLVRLRLLATIAPLAPAMRFATAHWRWGEHRGGMFVEIEGRDGAGAPVRRSWHLLAEGDDGPLIPSMAVAAIIHNALDGRRPQAGARASVRDLELEDYDRIFAGRTIHAGVRTDPAPAAAPLYARLLGDAWDKLPPQIRAMHDLSRGLAARGRASVERGTNPLAALTGSIMRFPSAVADTALTVRFDVADGVETWTRTFGVDRFSSRQLAGRGRSSRLLCERFGPLSFAMAVVWDGARLSLVMRRWTVFGVALPMWLCPRSQAYESVEDGRFAFHVEITHPMMGLVVRYKGWLAPEAVAAPEADGAGGDV